MTFHRAARKMFQETIVFTPHFGGNHATTKRHREFLNELGFDCVSFDLTFRHPLKLTMFINIWSNEIEEVLNAVPGNKIMYTFSSPSVATLAAIVEGKRKDVRAWITDSGPFFQVFHCLKKFFTYITPIAPAKRDLVTAVGFVQIGGIGFESRVKRQFEKFPREIPILSIRAGKDRLVPIAAIDAFFAAGENLNFQRFELPEAQHLEGLKVFPDLYKARVKEFLLQHARAINV
jgi:pimeloyl-ACP methyl ester carboxylesterase